LNACVVLSAILLLFSIIRRPLRSTLFPYTTLFRSSIGIEGGVGTVRSVRLSNAQTTSPSPSPTAPSFAPNASIAVLTHSRLMNRSEEHTSELQSLTNLVCRLLLEKKKKHNNTLLHR